MNLTPRIVLALLCLALAACASDTGPSQPVDCHIAGFYTTYIESCTDVNGVEQCDEIPEQQPIWVCEQASPTP